MVDFGADEACGKAAEKLKEHHGLEVCEKQSAEVLEELARRLEPESEPEENAPARRAHRYLDKRRDQLDYQSALGRGLPVGSGIIESGRRHVLQARLKIPGAWWKPENAHDMAQLRACRANGLWRTLWLN